MVPMMQIRAPRSPQMTLRDLLSGNIETIETKVAASVAWDKMRTQNVHQLLVTNNGRPVGILTERGVGGPNGDPALRQRHLVGDLMIPRVVSAQSTVSLGDAASLMQSESVGCLVVTEEGKPVGIVTAGDVFDELGRDPNREPFRGWFPRAVKPDLPGHPNMVPAHIRVLGVDLNKEKREHVRQKLGSKLGKFSSSIERVSVRVEDANGPRGGVDQVCRIKAVLRNLPSVVFESRDASLDAAVNGAIAGIETAVQRTLQRKRMKPIKTSVRSRLPQDSAERGTDD